MIITETNTRNQTPKVIVPSYWNILAVMILTVCLAIGADEVTAPTDYIPALMKKAESGDANAQRDLGDCYAVGKVFPKDDALAVMWYRKAAEQGHANAQMALGAYYIKGEGVPKDDALGVTWIRKAAEQGHALAQWGLGACYTDGTGVPKDDILAYMWYNLAAVTNPNAAKNRDIISKNMTREQIAEAQRLSREWKPTETKK